eukprot:scaffold264446_cov33-Tisochrysis_lutea.AAC.8
MSGSRSYYYYTLGFTTILTAIPGRTSRHLLRAIGKRALSCYVACCECLKSVYGGVRREACRLVLVCLFGWYPIAVASTT